MNCILCQNEFVTEHILELDFVATGEYTYLWDLDRGGLKWPTDWLVEIVTQVYLVFQCIVSPVYETKFLEQPNNKAIIVGLSMERIKMLGLLEGECICGTPLCNLVKHAVSILSNIFFNNYCKRASDRQNAHSSKTVKSARKISTFHK